MSIAHWLGPGFAQLIIYHVLMGLILFISAKIVILMIDLRKAIILLLVSIILILAACNPVQTFEPVEDSSEQRMTQTHSVETSYPGHASTPFPNQSSNVEEQFLTPNTETSEQLKTFGQSYPLIYPPFKISYNPSVWEYRNIEPNNSRTFKALFSKQYPSCYFNYGGQPHPNFEPAEFITIDERIFLSRREAISLIILDTEKEVIIYDFTFPGIDGIENTPTPRGRYIGHWKFSLIANPEEMESCYPLVIDLLRTFEPQPEPVATQMSNPYATLHFNLGKQEDYQISFSYFDSEWVKVNEGNPNPILISRTLPECSFEGYNQGALPDTSGWDEFTVYDETYFWMREPEHYSRPDTRVILYTPVLKTWRFEIYSPAESLDECMAAAKKLLEHRELTPIKP